MQINIFNVIVVLGFINPINTHTHKTYSGTHKTKIEKGILKSTFISTGIVLLSIFWSEPIVPLSEYCFDVLTIFPKYTKNRARLNKENIIF
jgi:hypothetical protein